MNSNYLHIGGISALDLIDKYGTPLFVYDIERVRENARSFVHTFQKLEVPFQVAYASKAFSSIAMLQVAKQEGLSLDVVSEGEIYTAIEADFPREKIHLHGNNKSEAELRMAIEQDIGCIVVDNFYEIALLKDLLYEYDKEVNVLLRLTPGIEAHTHDYILTGQEDSKFGFDINSDQADQALQQLLDDDRFKVLGVHCHIGSQIFETSGFIMAIRKLFEALGRWNRTFDYEASVINLGGGFGIKYTDEDEPLPLNEYVVALVESVQQHATDKNLKLPEIWIEPGRSIVGDAGTTLYTIGSIKEVPNVRKYASVDGGMTDNIRPALYQAKYDAVVANKLDQERTELVSIAGKCCESGDMLIWDLKVPEIANGDLLAVYSTGAYGYAMSNNYNRFPKAAVVFVENGKDQLVVKREHYKDVLRYDLSYE
ncbi:diaminopimelate decarboxylase [Halalkalibacillus sediminis]|uniref:Diaminopimelate decarboxylase n=1 Tax=Halalkalibacillus sediminis TaxID=2018042 RepID=A0A2I0QX62_9BACI|nr:diaminopimelate decarboxylase [Halalkalibacillus sediminis]PKR78899.1 diaminopimelate decarboxylase [Halalkalibacillus sediminis]